MGTSGVSAPVNSQAVEGHRMTSPSVPLYREIRLTKGQTAIVDAHNYERLSKHKWGAVWRKKTRSFYAFRRVGTNGSGNSSTIWMHREILNLTFEDPRQGDHKQSGLTLLNVESNLRIATHAQNCQNSRRPVTNTSGYKGVTKKGNKYRANIWDQGKQQYLGSRDTPQAAHELYCEAALRIRGEFARFE